ncbi:DUF2442 domain-containing protein [Fulvimarina sp. 2208YS6-2-32]|uniref:DUF2442 domain-containing protein n=1 Tax=Fulvimarina uroteuthidis TaxID=3098149 RepID=A0ABU5HY69_9HYPH|nr:DUF2442 domain-containing protein [Fulvimarina sp. 2208YS6-2-32]MDY8108076.1 DUF2442 domain-containing protein [Fulvimarina sp. 2208YS6-2-32]
MPGTVILDENWEAFEPVSAECTSGQLVVSLANGMTLSTPLWWYPTLLRASETERNTIELSPSGVHWPLIDEDLSISGMLNGRRYPGAMPPAEAAE